MNRIKVSAVVVVRNEQKHIEKCISSILDCQLAPEEFEVLVVDGMSDDGSREIVQSIMRRAPNVRLLDNTARITPTGLNVGVRHSCGDYIVIMGSHCEYPPNYLGICIRELQKTGADVVGARLTTKAGAGTLSARAIALATQHPFAVGNSGFRTGHPGGFVDTVPFGAYRRNVFERVGLFREDLVRHQDFELNARVRASGGRLYLMPDVQVTYYNVPTLRRFIRQGYTKGLWIGRGWVWSSVCFCLRHAAPFAFVVAMTLLALAGAMIPAAGRFAFGISSVYVLMGAVAGVQVALHNGWLYALLLPPMIAIYHISYGIGTLVGLVHGLLRKPAPIPALAPVAWESNSNLPKKGPELARGIDPGCQSAAAAELRPS